MEKEEKKEKKKEKKEGRKTGGWKAKRWLIRGCWLVAAGSLAFGVYKNFTAVDTVTIKETEKITEKIENDSGLETFTENFARIYFTNSQDSKEQNARKEKLAGYMQPSLVELNSKTVQIEGTVTVSDVQVWGIESTKEKSVYEVYYTVTMQREDQTEVSAYTMDVYREGQSYIVTKNPTVASTPTVADYAEPYLEASDLLGAEEREKVETFLSTFFTVYPKATEKELAYYVRDDRIKPIGKEYELLSIDNTAIEAQGEGRFRVECYVTYYDQQLHTSMINQYELALAPQDDGELIIAEMR